MNIAIIGASGFIGKNLTKYLLENTNHNIFAISRNIDDISIEEKFKNRVKIIKADVLCYKEIEVSLFGIDVAYYLIHLMTDNKKDFYYKESQAAETTGRALKFQKVKRVIYMSGLGNDKEKLSLHLASRHNTGDIIRKYIDEVIELQ